MGLKSGLGVQPNGQVHDFDRKVVLGLPDQRGLSFLHVNSTGELRLDEVDAERQDEGQELLQHRGEGWGPRGMLSQGTHQPLVAGGEAGLEFGGGVERLVNGGSGIGRPGGECGLGSGLGLGLGLGLVG